MRKLYLQESTTNARRAHALSRTTLQIGADSEVSFATYFNAFPASYWRRWTICKSVVLRAELTGVGRVDVYRTKATGARIFVDGRTFDGGPDQPATLEFLVGLDPFEDGGWIWFDITTETDVTLHSAGWYATEPAPGVANIAVGIPTFNRPGDCVNALQALTSDPLVDKVIGAVIVPDQGTAKVRDHPDFAKAAAPLGNRLSIHDQPNLGGSGGYSRVMYEALKNTDCQQILFMDDDIRIEPDSILRVLAMHRFAKSPMLVGGQMLNLQEPSHLHIMGEVVDRSNFMWTAAPYAEYDHDFAAYPLSDNNPRSNLLHRRIDVDYNGWWTCMIPRQVAEELGQPLPLFIKWDDADYGLRAAEHGYPTATLPGAAIWHMAWSDKDDAIDWQAYFHLRNRLVVAAMHWDDNVVGLLRSHLRATLKHLACLEYSTVAIQNKAIDDFLAGPEHIFSILETALPEVHRIRKAYPDAIVLPTASELPAPSQKTTPMKPPCIRWPSAIGWPGHAAQPDQGRPGAPPAPTAQRGHPGRPVVSAVHPRRCDGDDGRRPRCGVPPARPGHDVHAAVAVAAPPGHADTPLRRDAPGIPRRPAGAVQQAEVGNGAAVSDGQSAGAWLSSPRRAAKWRRWWRFSRRWATIPVSCPWPKRCHISVSTASVG
ncbi:UDP-galactofuranosyl transferase GlfT2 [Mycobacterium xenopi 4042]|uniref:UDP-galactofuranosyl transferase GlfT2 n=1 Tax=Mycobacterium xenopi 4042 TaxID=1299334 RepID=X8DJY8_MYCXE|nr:UDP-galactofuranosyl transferase GlfT2 [Mycobacterium xenopi 4042]